MNLLDIMVIGLFLVVYLFFCFHSLSVMERFRDRKFVDKLLAYLYFVAVVFGIPTIFCVYIVTRWSY